MWCYVGLSAGDLTSGLLSHWLQSRRRAVLYLMLLTLMGSLAYLYADLTTPQALYAVTGLLGFGIGYWAMFVTIGAEQFGTNLRATAATTIPNMVRGTVVGMTTLYGLTKPTFDVIGAGALVGLVCFVIGFYSVLTIPETHNKDLNFVEQ